MASIIKTVDEFKVYANAYANIWPQIQPEREDAQDEVAKYASAELMDALVTAYQAAPVTPLASKWSTILPYVQRCVSELAISLYIPKKGLGNLGQEGLTQPNGENVKASSGWVAEKMSREYKKGYYKQIDKLLAFLEKNKGVYNEWATSSARTFYKELFVGNTDTFSKWYNINDSRRTFLALVQSLRIAEDMVLDVIGEDFYNALKAELNNNSYSDENKKVMKYIERACCYLAINYGLMDLSLTIDEQGVTVMDNTSGRDNVENKKDAGMEVIAAKANAAFQEGTRILSKLKEFLIANSSDYPLFVVPEITSGKIDNTDKNIISL